MPERAASGIAYSISGVAQVFAIVGAPFFGIAADYVGRPCIVAVAALFASVGYLWTFFMPDPTSKVMFGVAGFVGIGEIGMIVTSQLLVSVEAPKDSRYLLFSQYDLTVFPEAL